MKMTFVVTGILALAAAGFWYFGGAERPQNAKSRKSFYDLSFTLIDGTKKSFSEFKGKKILIVNVASQCGFTPQYEQLEKLYQENKPKLVIVGFPANDFLGQEPGSNDEIRKFCDERYRVTFPLSQKISVVGESKSEIYRWLSDDEFNGWNNKGPKWNFYKYLISESGELLHVYPSTVEPMSKEVLDAL